MKHMIHELLEMFVDGTNLSHNQFQFLMDNDMIHEVEVGAWALTDLGKDALYWNK